MKVERVYLDGIEVGERLRPLNADRVSAMQTSIQEIGLRTPLTVMSKIVGEDTQMVLVAGHHRLAALLALGEDAAPCFVIEDNEIDAKLWEITENLYRADLTKEQRDEHIRLYAELLRHKERNDKPTQVASVYDAGGRGNKGVAAKVAEQTGLSKDTVRRALNPDRVANERARSKIDADVKQRAAREVAEMIAERFPADMWDGLKANLYAAGASNIAHELTNITGQSIMDGRYAA